MAYNPILIGTVANDGTGDRPRAAAIKINAGFNELTSAFALLASRVTSLESGASVPGMPANVAGAPGNGSVSLTWDAPTVNGSGAITDYTVTVYFTNGELATGVTGATTRNVGSASPAFIFTGLVNGTAYIFKVIAVAGIVIGAQSAASIPVTPVSSTLLPAAPTIGTPILGVPGFSAVDVHFTPPVANGSPAIDSYIVTPHLDGTAQSPITFGAPLTSPKTVTGLLASRSYTFKVRAHNVNGDGPDSALSSPPIMTSAGGPVAPGKPTSVIAENPGTGGLINVLFVRPVVNGGAAITSYRVTVFSGGIATGMIVDGFGTADPVIIPVSGLINGTLYTFTVKAFNSVGFGLESDATAPPLAPTGADVTNPTISVLSPANGTNGVSSVADLVITFSEPVVVVSGDITITATGGAIFATIDVTSGLVTGSGTNTITINPTAPLASGTAYHVNIAATAFDDVAGNSFAGILSPDATTWNFTTSAVVAAQARYWGFANPVDPANPTNAEILALINDTASDFVLETASLAANNNYIYYAYPAGFGPLNHSYIDNDTTFDALTGFILITQNVTPVTGSTSGIATSYRIYRSEFQYLPNAGVIHDFL